MRRFPVHNVFELPRVRKQRPVLVQTRRKAAGKAVQLLIRKGYLRREKRDTQEFEPVRTVTVDTPRLRRFVLETRQRLAESGQYFDDYVLLVNPSFFHHECATERPFPVATPVTVSGRPNFFGMDVYLWSGINTVLIIPKSIFKTA